MDTATLLKKVRKIEIKTRGLSKHIFSGEYHSAFKGRGMSFSEVRDYTYGDDVRNIDWNVTARTGHPHIKVFEEERELTVMLLIDVSRSNYFSSGQQLKSELYTEIAAVLAFSAINNNDKVGLILFSEKVEMYIPPKKGKQHILRIIRELIHFEPEATGTDIGGALRYFNNVIKKRSICFLLSDFQAEGYEAAMRIAARKHDVIGVKVSDPFEINVPNIGLVRGIDAERNEVSIIDTSNNRERDALQAYFKKFEDYFKATAPKSGVDILPLSTDESYVNALLKFFKKRRA